MNVCELCGKTMATRGGLEIHLELAHPPDPGPGAVAAAPVPAGSEDVAPPTVVPPRPTATDWKVPRFLQGVDPTVPLTALLMLALLVAAIGAAVHRGSRNAPNLAAVQSAPAGAATAAAPAVDPVADNKLAQSLVLTQNDYPDGWTLTPHQTSPTDAQDNRLDAACLGLPDPATTETADVTGMDAHDTDAVQVTTGAIVFRTQQQATNDLAAQGGSRAEACAKQGLTRALAADGITVTDVGVGRFALSSGNVHSVALHTEIAVAKGQARGLIYADIAFLQQGRVEGQALFLSFDGRFPLDTERTLVTRFAHRLAGA